VKNRLIRCRHDRRNALVPPRPWRSLAIEIRWRKAMKHVCLRLIQLAVLAALAIVALPRPAPANELGCYAICIYDDWACMIATGHLADACGYDREQDICNLGACQLQPY
jgi:hypothetical protein